MSFLRTLSRKAAPLARTRLFTTTPCIQKSASETAKETIDSANKTVGDAAVRGIEKGQQATQSLKSTVGAKSSEASGSASQMTREAKGKAAEASGSASQMSGEAKGKASDMTGEVKGKASEMAGEAKGKAQEVKGEVKSKM